MSRDRNVPVSQELIKGTVVPVVLAMLEGGARYGYEMVQAVNVRTNGALEWSEGTLYPVLHRLEADGLVAAEWRTAAAREGGRPRRYYALTGAGRRELKRRAVEWKTFAAAMGEFFGRTRAVPWHGPPAREADAEHGLAARATGARIAGLLRWFGRARVGACGGVA